MHFVAAVNSSDDKETAFAELAPDYVSEDDKEDYEADPDASLHTGTVGSSLSYQSFGEWLMDDSRASGDVGVVESSSGYYAVMLLNRYRDETATADIRHILIKAEVADADDPATEDVDESKVPTQEALDAAKAEAEDILAQWEAGDKTAESFGALAEEYSDDPGSNTNGGLYEQVAPGVMFEGFNDWIFADGRAIGDTGLVENPQDGPAGLAHHLPGGLGRARLEAHRQERADQREAEHLAGGPDGKHGGHPGRRRQVPRRVRDIMGQAGGALLRPPVFGKG